MAYTKFYADWKNSPDTSTPITEAAMDHIEDGIVAAHALMPAGVLAAYGGSSAPSGWLLCDGSAVSQATYAALYTAIGLAYGNPGGGNFNLPDLRGRVAAGYAASGGHADVSTLGNSDAVTVANRRPKHTHTHTLTLPNHIHNSGNANDGGSNDNQTGTGSSNTSGRPVGNPTTNPSIPGTIGTSTDSSDAPAYLVVNYIIKT